MDNQSSITTTVLENEENQTESLLELAANNDTLKFKQIIEQNPSSIDEIGSWYCRLKGTKQMILENRTPLMVASTYGSLDVLRLILSTSTATVNLPCGSTATTALHCAASGGSSSSISAVKLLLSAGANISTVDSNNLRPYDLIVSPPNLPHLKSSLELLLHDGSSSHPPSPELRPQPPPEKKEYPMDPSLPDIKNSMYSTDEFRMFSFKIRPCSRAYSHDWTECPFVHPGENARRRDPRKFHYSCVPCPEFRKGACRRGDICEYAHGVFECWLHPAQYRTRLCKDGVSCNRRVCFFAHTVEELRPLYVSTGCAVPSPRAGDIGLHPGSPSQFTPPMSPSGSMAWPPPSVPSLHLPGGGGSRLRSSLSARDMPVDDYDLQMINELSFLSQSGLGSGGSRPSQLSMLAPSNLEELFSTEGCCSPKYSDQGLAPSVFSPKHFQQHQSLLSPIKTGFSGRMSPVGMEVISPMNSSSRVSSGYGQQQERQFRNLSSREFGSGSPSGLWNKWGAEGEEGPHNFEGDEPDLSWVHSLVKESPAEGGSADGDGGLPAELQAEHDHTVLGAWLEQMQLDQLMAQ